MRTIALTHIYKLKEMSFQIVATLKHIGELRHATNKHKLACPKIIYATLNDFFQDNQLSLDHM